MGIGKEITFISDSTEINSSFYRYFKYIHNLRTTPLLFSNIGQIAVLNHISLIIVQNEVIIEDQEYGIYPFWFDWGLMNKVHVYGFTYKKINSVKNNTFDWETVLDKASLKHFSDKIDLKNIPYFDATVSILHNILKPHGTDSLYDLVSQLHFSFMDVSKKIKFKTISKSLLNIIKNTFIKTGLRIFINFKNKEKKYHKFLSYLPNSHNVFEAIKSLEEIINVLNQLIHENQTILSKLPYLFQKSEQQIMLIYYFFNNLENYLKLYRGGKKC
jgi:hypothetical protein